MIIDKNRILDFKQFSSGLQSAARAVGRLSNGNFGSSLCTAWLITPDLIVAPDYALNIGSTNSTDGYIFYPDTDEGKVNGIGAVALYPLGLINTFNPEDIKATLLRLKEPIKGAHLPLAMHSLQEVDQLYILHYPAAYPQLQISFGRLGQINDISFYHDADTEAGSGGGPVLDSYGSVIGIHVAKSEHLSMALKLETILRHLLDLPEWKEIAAWHRLVLLTDPKLPSDPVGSMDGLSRSSPDRSKFLIRQALLWSSDPAVLSEQEKRELLPLVVNAEASLWSLRTEEHTKIIQSTGSLQLLRAARGGGGPDHPGQKVIDRILVGGPYKMEEIGDAALPYWLQIVRWFNEVVPDLPAPAGISREMEKRRTRGKLSLLAGPDFRGREKELDTLKKWYGALSPGAMMISGIGGIGKSSLVSQFSLGLSEKTLIWWLDFDRADIAPDHALSMLSVLAQQADIQLNGIEQPGPTLTEWKEAAAKLSSQVAGKIDKKNYPLLILDGFEVAQQVRRYNELWPVLETLLRSLPLRVIVSGRAPLPSLQLAGRPTSHLILEGMDAESARIWLRLHGIEDKEVVKKVLEMSRGIPLILKLAARLVETGGDIQSLPGSLPDEIRDGFLYQRILDRVIDPLLQPVAKDVLVVRRLSREMLADVFYDRLPEGLSVEAVFSSLMNEMGLVEEEEGRISAIALSTGSEPDELCIRPEVRLATLKLLEKEDAARVTEIDGRVAEWYKTLSPSGNDADLPEIAERIYHNLRLGKIAEAKKFWTEDCIPFFTNAAEELPKGREDAKTWLLSQLRTTSASFVLETWEKDALPRIRDAASRSQKRAMLGILQEKKERTAESPLLIYDAWAMAETGDLAGARTILHTAPAGNMEIQRNRWIVQAMLAWNDNDNKAADDLLRNMDLPIGVDLPHYREEQLLIRAARVRMTEDLAKEGTLYNELQTQLSNDWQLSTITSFLITPDIIHPDLGGMFINYSQSSASRAYHIPSSEDERQNFIKYLEDGRRRLTRRGNWQIRYNEPPPNAGPYYQHMALWEKEIDDVIDDILLHYPEQKDVLLSAFSLARQAMRRWVLVTKDLFLAGSLEFLDNPKIFATPENFLSILMTWFTLNGQEMIIGSKYSDRRAYNVGDFINFTLKNAPYKTFALAPGARACATALKVLETRKGKSDIYFQISNWLHEDGMNSPAAGTQLYDLIAKFHPNEALPLLYILGPQPLEILYYRSLGIPFNKLST